MVLTAPLAAATPTLSQPFYPGRAASIPKPSIRISRPALPAGPHRQLHPHHSARNQLAPPPGSRLHRKDLENEFLDQLDAVPYYDHARTARPSHRLTPRCTSRCSSIGVSAAERDRAAVHRIALGGASSAFCKGFSSCTAAVASNYGSLIKEMAASDLWNKLNSANGWTLDAPCSVSRSPVARWAIVRTGHDYQQRLGEL